MPQNRGSFTPAPGILFTRKRGLRLFSIFFSHAQLQRGNPQLVHQRGNSQSRTLDLARDVMQPHVYLFPHGRPHPAGIYSLLPDPDHTCSHDVTLHIQKANLAGGETNGVSGAISARMEGEIVDTRGRERGMADAPSH